MSEDRSELTAALERALAKAFGDDLTPPVHAEIGVAHPAVPPDTSKGGFYQGVRCVRCGGAWSPKEKITERCKAPAPETYASKGWASVALVVEKMGPRNFMLQLAQKGSAGSSLWLAGFGVPHEAGIAGEQDRDVGIAVGMAAAKRLGVLRW